MAKNKLGIEIGIEKYPKITVAMTREMLKALEEERKVRKIATIPEVVRIIVSEYFKTKSEKSS